MLAVLLFNTAPALPETLVNVPLFVTFARVPSFIAVAPSPIVVNLVTEPVVLSNIPCVTLSSCSIVPSFATVPVVLTVVEPVPLTF